MELKDLVGKHMLDAVDFSEESVETYSGVFEDCSVCRFRLNGVVYIACEDPEDGYRSTMSELMEDKLAVMKNVFAPIEVIGKHNGYIIVFVDTITDKIVLEVGTEDFDDYYPYYVASFHPENMVTNKESSTKLKGE